MVISVFGYIRPYMPALSEADQKRYRAHYCGLCRTLYTRFGLKGQAFLNYDMIFLSMLLASLYEPAETLRTASCVPHPVRRHEEVISPASDYAADMTILLAYFKACDDRQDEKKASGWATTRLLGEAFRNVSAQYPNQTVHISECMQQIRKAETATDTQPEAIAAFSGEILAAIFPWKPDDFWARDLARFGSLLGQYVYWLDAVVDDRHDLKHHCYNPLHVLGVHAQDMHPVLLQNISQAAELFETWPLVQDLDILRNIVYQGVWQAYNQVLRKEGVPVDP